MKIMNGLTRWTAVLSGVGVTILMLLTVADVVRRQAVGKSIPGALEVSEVVLVFIVFLGLAAAEADGAHVRTSLITSRLKPGVRRWLTAAAGLLVLLVLVMLLYAATGRALDAFETREFRFGLVKVPTWPARIMIPVGIALLLAEYSRTLWRTWRLQPTSSVEQAPPPPM